MAGIFTKRIWQPCIWQPNELKREIKKKTGGAKRGTKQKSGWAMAHLGPPLESPLTQHKSLSCMVTFRCNEDGFAAVNPIKPNIGLWISSEPSPESRQ